MPAVSRLGDTSNHGGTITSASTDVKNGGLGIARNGDTFNCPIHGPNKTLTAITTKTRVNGQLVITVGAQVSCGAIITQGSSNFNAS